MTCSSRQGCLLIAVVDRRCDLNKHILLFRFLLCASRESLVPAVFDTIFSLAAQYSFTVFTTWIVISCRVFFVAVRGCVFLVTVLDFAPTRIIAASIIVDNNRIMIYHDADHETF